MRETAAVQAVLVIAVVAMAVTATNITLVGMFPITGSWSVGGPVKVGAELGIESVNADPTILPGKDLVLHWENTDCDARTGLLAMLGVINDVPEAVALVGAGCSVVSQPVAGLADVFAYPMVSWGSTSVALSDKSRFPWFMRTVGPDDWQAQAWVSLAAEFGWNDVGLVSFSQELHVALARRFSEGLEESGDGRVARWEILDPEASEAEIDAALERIWDTGVRVLFVASYTDSAQSLLRGVQRTTAFGEGYAVVGSEAWVRTDEPVWTVENGTDESVRSVSLGLLATLPTPGQGSLWESFATNYTARTGTPRAEINPYVSYAYDAVWMVAHGLHALIEGPGAAYPGGVPSSTDTVAHSAFREALRTYLYEQTEFEGVTGLVQLNELGDRIPTYDIVNVASTGDPWEMRVVGLWDGTLGDQALVLEDSQLVFPGGGSSPPPDGIEDSNGPDTTLIAAVTASVGGAGLLVAAFGLLALCAVCGCTLLAVLVVLLAIIAVASIALVGLGRAAVRLLRVTDMEVVPGSEINDDL